MSYAKAVEKYVEPVQADDHLCSEAGCQRRWTVDFGVKLCREHFKATEHKASAPPAGWASEAKARIRRVS